MLSDYRERQPIAYNIMMNEIKNNCVTHAYLVDENKCNEAFDIVMAFVKELLCSKLDSEDSQILCKRIDGGNYPEIKVIEPDGMLIRKQQIIDLQQDFSRSAIEGHKRIYIIRDVEKMRAETANSMLKFLEEPDNDIMAILMSNNCNNILPTIVSRCQIIRLNGDNSVDNEGIKDVILFVLSIEKNGVRTIIEEQNLLFDNINLKEREKFVDFFDKMIDIYYDILNILIGKKEIKFSAYTKELSDVASRNTQSVILEKINCLVDVKDAVKKNVNINLLIDSLIVKFGGLYEDNWS